MKKLQLSLFSLLALNILNAGETVSMEEVNASVQNHTFKFALETGIKQNHWNPGLAKSDGQYLLNYDTEGINVYYGKLKGKVKNTDIFVLEAYRPIDDSANQKYLISERKRDDKENSFIEGVRFSIHLSKLLDYLLETDTIGNFDFEYESRNFVGLGTLTQNSFYWFGQNTGDINQDYLPIEKGTNLSFKTKFETYKLIYTWEKLLGGFDFSLGGFDATWSKPTFTQTYALKEVPVFFHANYHTQGVSLNIGQEEKNYKIKAFLDYGLNNEIKLTNTISASDILEQNEKLSMMIYGLTADRRINLFTHKKVYFDFVIGGNVQYSKIGRDYTDTKLDAEFNWGYHVGLEATF